MDNYILETVQSIIPDAPSTLLNYYMSKATNYFLLKTHQSTIPTNAQDIIAELIIIYYNKFGYEGLTSTSQNGISLNWGNDLPSDLRGSIVEFTCIKWV